MISCHDFHDLWKSWRDSWSFWTKLFHIWAPHNCSKFHVNCAWENFGHRVANAWSYLSEKRRRWLKKTRTWFSWAATRSKSLNSKTKHVNSPEVVEKLGKINIIQSFIGCSSKGLAQKNPKQNMHIGVSSELQNLTGNLSWGDGGFEIGSLN